MRSARSHPPHRASSSFDANMSSNTVPAPMTATESNNATSPKSRFYLPSPATTTGGLSRVPSRHGASSLSVPSSPRSRQGSHRRSKSSLAALRSALQSYKVPDPEDSTIPERRGSDVHGHGEDMISVSELDLEQGEWSSRLMLEQQTYMNGLRLSRSGTGPGSRSPFVMPLGREMMDALVDIHRVLYRGREDLESVSQERQDWDRGQQAKEVQRVVERWFEGDCLYDHPLAQVSSRESLLSHFVLLHLVSTVHLPSVSPGALVEHARSLTSALKSKVLGSDTAPDTLRLAQLEGNPYRHSYKGKGKEKEKEVLEEWAVSQTERDEKRGWWRVWDISADCREIGGMECYDGYHLALIEHTITLTLFPSLSSRKASISSLPSTPATYASDDISRPPLLTARIPPPPFLTRLIQSLAEEFDYFLHWDLPISTFVEFNEVGKATRIRDVIDVRDAIETFVPFAKRVGWLTRRVTGLATSTMGAIAQGVIGGPKVLLTEGIRVQTGQDNWDPISKPLLDEKLKHEFGIGLGLGLEGSGQAGSDHNSLGLEGIQGEINQPIRDDIDTESMGSMAPDCDDSDMGPEQ